MIIVYLYYFSLLCSSIIEKKVQQFLHKFYSFIFRLLYHGRNVQPKLLETFRCPQQNVPNPLKRRISGIEKPQVMYRTRAIISRGLYIFLPHFQRPFMYCDILVEDLLSADFEQCGIFFEQFSALCKDLLYFVIGEQPIKLELGPLKTYVGHSQKKIFATKSNKF